MKETKYTVKYTTSFKKDYKRAIKRGLKIELLEEVVAMLAMGEPLPDKNRDHDLQCQLKCKLHALVPAEARILPQTLDLSHIQPGFWSPCSLQWQWVWDLLLSHNQQHGG